MRDITRHQRRILTLHDSGLTIKQISEEVKLNESSVRAQLKRIRNKIKAGTYKPTPLPLEQVTE